MIYSNIPSNIVLIGNLTVNGAYILKTI